MNVSSKKIVEFKPLILIIDDDNVSRKTVAAILSKNGYDVTQAENGEEGIIQFQKTKPDLVLLDVVMPGLNGYEVCEKIRSICVESIEAMPIVMLTGQNDAKSIESAFSAGATDFITKPVNLKLLGQRITYILRNSQNYKELQDKEKQLDRAQHIARLGYWRMEILSQQIFLSDQCAAMLKRTNDSIPPSYEEMMTLVHPDDRSTIIKTMEELFSTKSSYSLEHRILLANGKELFVVHQGEYISASNAKEQDYILGTIQDVTELREAQSEAQYQKYYDSATGLPNRQSFEIHLEHLVSDHKNLTAVVFISLDQFSVLNETIGHEGGDYIFNIITKRLCEIERQGHYISRFAADRFALILRNILHFDDCEEIINSILNNIRHPIDYKNNKHYVTASIGISLFPIESNNSSELIQWAESAVQQAKDNGGDRFAFHTTERNQRAQQRLTLEQEMRKGIENNEFVVFYQPQVSASTGQIKGMEALVRWQHPERGMVSPGEFIPLAEETGLIIPIGEQVLRTACLNTQNWLQSGYALLVGVNLSAKQFALPNLIQIVESALADSHLPASALELEVTESMAMNDVEETIEKLKSLQALGIKTSLDDFGTGYSSLSYLQKMPLSTLKVDQSFVSCIEYDGVNLDKAKHGSGAIAATVINLSNNLGLHVIAEGIETQSQFEFLQSFGELTLQGYYFSRPLPQDQFEKALFHKTALPHPES